MEKQLRVFLRDLLQVSCLRGFLYFSTYTRGKEELLVSIINSPQDCQQDAANEAQLALQLEAKRDTTSSQLPYDKSALMLSGRTQKALSGQGHLGVGLPPASPSESETSDENSTLFLVAGYAKYSAPYVWVRSHHERLVRLTRGDSESRDSPLKLTSTYKWTKQMVAVWEILAELVLICTVPAPHNPFTVDYSYFKSLPRRPRFLATAAMVHFLQQIILSCQEDLPYLASNIDELLSVNYGIDILDKPVLAGEAIEGAIYLKSKFGQSYQCTYPNTLKDEQKDTEDEKEAHEVGIPELLKPLESQPCLLHTKGWWTYELCLKKAVTQYHTEDGKPSGVIMNLGNYEYEYEWSETSAESKKSRRSSRQYHSQYYTNGSLCELTGNLRKTEIVFKCKAKQRTAVFSVDEPETCVYVITVHTDLLCSHPLLAPPAATPSIPITCHPLLSDTDYTDYMTQKEEREKKREEAMNKARDKSSVAADKTEDSETTDDSDTASATTSSRASMLDDAMQIVQDELHMSDEDLDDSQLIRMFEKEMADISDKPDQVTKWSSSKKRLMSAMQAQFTDIIDETEEENEGEEINRELAYKELTQMLGKLLQRLDTAQKDIQLMDDEIEKKLMLQKILEEEFNAEIDDIGTDFSADSASESQTLQQSDVRIVDDDDDDDDDDMEGIDITKTADTQSETQVDDKSEQTLEKETADKKPTAVETETSGSEESPAVPEESSPQDATASRRRRFANTVKIKATDKTPEIPKKTEDEETTSQNIAEVVKDKLKQSGIDTHGRKIEVKIITRYLDGAGEGDEAGNTNKVVIAVISGNDDEVEQQKHQYKLEKGYNFSWQKKRPKTQNTEDNAIPPA